jgi:hypothetical protein
VNGVRILEQMKDLENAISEYKEAMASFIGHPEVVLSSLPSPEYKVISDRYFAARENLAEIAEKSDNPLARDWHRAYAAAMENARLMVSSAMISERIMKVCAKRMKDFKKTEEALLDFFTS